jgi:hypothetical protein
MNQNIVTVSGAQLPALIAPTPGAGKCYVEFFTATISA